MSDSGSAVGRSVLANGAVGVRVGLSALDREKLGADQPPATTGVLASASFLTSSTHLLIMDFMEQSLAQSASRVMQNDGVQGVLCADDSGNLHCGRGTLDQRSAVIVAHIAALAAQIQIDDPIEPIVSLQSETSRLFIRRYNGIVVGVHKLI